MCDAIEYQGDDVYFPNPEAKLPVRNRDGSVTWMSWGSINQIDRTFPNGGWARVESITKGRWKKWHPTPVVIVCDRFMVKDAKNFPHWIDVDPCMAIQGLIAERDGRQLVYIVTEAPPPTYEWTRDQYPRLVRLIKEPLKQ